MSDDQKQSATTTGHGNLIVQIQGDGNTLDLDRPYLRLTRFANRETVRENEGDAGLLQAYSLGVVDLIGREGELADFKAWMNTGDPVSVRALVGPAGRGKTRFALELCRELAAKGVVAGFATTKELTRFQYAKNIAEWGWEKPTLIVIDYAAGAQAQVRDFLTELADNALVGSPDTGLTRPLRVLLLERRYDEGMGWWHALFGDGNSEAEDRARLLDPAHDTPIELPTLADPVHRRRVLDSMLDRVGAPHRAPPAGTNPGFGTALESAIWAGDPLFLMMAALLSKKHGLIQVLSLARQDLAIKIARRERARVVRFARDRKESEETASLLNHLIAAITLLEGQPLTRLPDLIKEERKATDRTGAASPAVITQYLQELLTISGPEGGDGSMTGLDAVRPDMIGEALILAAFADDKTVLDPPATIERLARHDSAAVCRALIRTTANYAPARRSQDGAEQAGRAEPLEWLERLEPGLDDDIATLVAVSDAIPHDTLAMREYSARVSKRLVDLFRTVSEEREEFRPVLAMSLNNLSNRLSDLGRREDALAACEESVALYRTLASQRRGAFTPNLAMSLNNLSNRLAELGRREDALAACEEAVALYRTLAEQRPDAFTPDLAASLNNLSGCLSGLGRPENALAACEESVALRRNLAVQRPDIFTPKLASSLNNLSNCMSDLKRREDALAACEGSVALYRTLAEQRPDAFTPDLAMSLNNLSGCLADLGQREDALAACEEAVALRRTLADQRPDAFTPHLAMSLGALGRVHLGNNRSDLALRAFQEGLQQMAPFAARLPEAYDRLLSALFGDALRAHLGIGSSMEAVQVWASQLSLPDGLRQALEQATPDLYRRLQTETAAPEGTGEEGPTHD